MPDIRKETDSLGEVNVPADKLWGGAQTQRSLEYFSIGKLMSCLCVEPHARLAEIVGRVSLLRRPVRVFCKK